MVLFHPFSLEYECVDLTSFIYSALKSQHAGDGRAGVRMTYLMITGSLVIKLSICSKSSVVYLLFCGHFLNHYFV